ncbi:MAG TPA: ComEC/Rec2 family competence protein [Nannocystis sp.]
MLWVSAGDLSSPAAPRWPGDGQGRSPGPSFHAEQLWLASGAPDGYWAAVARLRDAGEAAARGEPARGFVLAAVLGLPAALPPTTRSELRRAGLGHLVAVSGMNVAVAALLLRAPLLRLGLLLGGSPALGSALAWLPVAAYVGLTGAAAPAVRAAVMFTLVQLGVLCGRPAHGMTTLALAAAGLLAWSPAWAGDPGFHLSMVAMAVLLRPVAPGEAPPGLLAQSWQITWATCPVGLLHFGHAAVWGVLANLVAVPVFTLWVAPLGTIGCLLWPWIGDRVLAPAAWGGQLILDLAAVLARAPEIPIDGLLVAAAVMLALWWLWPRCRRGLPGPWVCAATIAAVIVARPDPDVTPPAWFAAGGGREHALVVPATSPGLACIRDPNLFPEAWPSLLRALGYRGVAGLAVKKGVEPPHLVELREQLMREGMWAPGECSFAEAALVEAAVVRLALRACLARTGQKTAAVRAGPDCHFGGAWGSLAEDGPPARVLRALGTAWQDLTERIDSRPP